MSGIRVFGRCTRAVVVLLAGVLAGCQPGTRNPYATVPDTLALPYLAASSGCNFKRVQQFNDPVALIAEYVQRGAEGQFLYLGDRVLGGPFESWTEWLLSAVLCPGKQPRYTSPSGLPSDPRLISGYTLGQAQRRGDSAVVSIVYAGLGKLDRQQGFLPALSSDTVKVIARRTYWGWRIDRPDPVFRLHLSVVSGRLHLSTATQAQLAEFCARHPEARCN